MYMEQNELEYLRDQVSQLTQTVKHLNMFCSSLIQSNQIISNQMKYLDEELDNKFEIVSKFLAKHGLTVEDLMEFETELRMNG